MIEVFADVRCPFTHAGLHRFVERRAELDRPDVVLWVRAWPLELVNDAPLEAGLIAEEVDELRDQVSPGLFRGFDERRFPASSLPALTLAAAAYARSPAHGERVSLALRDALFEQGRDIADPPTLAGIASDAGVEMPVEGTTAAVVDEWHEGRRRGVIGSPHFFVGGTGFFCPSLDIHRVDGHLRLSWDHDALARFLARCFAD